MNRPPSLLSSYCSREAWQDVIPADVDEGQHSVIRSFSQGQIQPPQDRLPIYRREPVFLFSLRAQRTYDSLLPNVPLRIFDRTPEPFSISQRFGLTRARSARQ